MRYALISDIHANQQAWEAVSKDIDEVGVDQVICLGDVVGYGPAPVRVLEGVYAKSSHFVLGNHDAVIGGQLDPECFYDEARYIIEWTRKNLNKFAKDFFAQVPMIVQDDAFLCVHAEAAVPDRYDYIFEPHEAIESFAACAQQLIFVGHTHCPCVMMKRGDDDPIYRAGKDFMIEDDFRYLVNVGSVGDPRDGDTRSSYCILDLDAKTVQYRKVEFDIEGFRIDLEKSKLPSKPVLFDFVNTPSSPSGQTQKIMNEFQPISMDELDAELARDASVEQLSTTARRKTVAIKNRTAGSPFGEPASPYRAKGSKGRAVLMASIFVALFVVIGALALLGYLKKPGGAGDGPGGQAIGGAPIDGGKTEDGSPVIGFSKEEFADPPAPSRRYQSVWPGGLVAHFPLDDKGAHFVVDASQAGRAGVLRNTFSSDGVIGKAIRFDGKQSAIGFMPDLFPFDSDKPFSFSCWMMASKIGHGPIWEKMDPDNGQRGVQLLLARDKLRFMMTHKWPNDAIEVTTSNPMNLAARTVAPAHVPLASAAKGQPLALGGVDFTFGVWLKTSSGEEVTILSKAPKNKGWETNGKALFLREGQLLFDVGWLGVVEGTGIVNDDQWHHVAVTYQEQTGSIILYRDGVKCGDGKVKGPDQPNHVVRLGYGPEGFTQSFIGTMDEARYFNRVLTEAEMKGLAAGEKTAALSKGLTAMWSMDENRGRTTANGVGGGFGGQLVGAAWTPGKDGSGLSFNGKGHLEIGDSRKEPTEAQIDFAAKAHGWQHLVVTYDGSAKAAGIQIFINGRNALLTIDKDGLTGSFDTDVPMTLGSRILGQPLFAGILDEAQLYDRALEPAEVGVLSRLAHVGPTGAAAVKPWAQLVKLEQDWSGARKLKRTKPDALAELRKRWTALSAGSAGTPYQRLAKKELEQLSVDSGEQAQDVVNQLKTQATALARSKEYLKAADTMLNYNGPLAAETRLERVKLARVWQKKGQEEKVKKGEEQRKRIETLAKSVAGDLLKGDRKASEKHLHGFKKKYKGGVGAGFNTLSNHVELIFQMPLTVMESFKSEVGKLVRVELSSGALQMTVKSVRGDTVVGTAEVTRGASKAKVDKTFRYKDLTPREKERRVGEKNEKVLELLRGVLVYQAASPDRAIEFFDKSKTDLGKALAEDIRGKFKKQAEETARKAIARLKQAVGVPEKEKDANRIKSLVTRKKYTASQVAAIEKDISRLNERYKDTKSVAANKVFLDALKNVHPYFTIPPQSGALFAYSMEATSKFEKDGKHFMKDISSARNDGAFVVNGKLSSDPFGRLMEFDNKVERCIRNSKPLNLRPSGSFTISYLAKRSSKHRKHNWMFTITLGDDFARGGKFGMFSVAEERTYRLWTLEKQWDSKVPVKHDVWQLHIIVHEADGTTRYYLNGKQIGEDFKQPLRLTDSLVIGGVPVEKKPGEIKDFYYGLLKDVHLYRRALTSTEIRTMHRQIAQFLPEPAKTK